MDRKKKTKLIALIETIPEFDAFPGSREYLIALIYADQKQEPFEKTKPVDHAITVYNAFKMNRSFSKTEHSYIHRWFDEYGMSNDVIVEACSRTLYYTGSAVFPYADALLRHWLELGIQTLSDLKELEEKKK